MRVPAGPRSCSSPRSAKAVRRGYKRSRRSSRPRATPITSVHAPRSASTRGGVPRDQRAGRGRGVLLARRRSGREPPRARRVARSVRRVVARPARGRSSDRVRLDRRDREREYARRPVSALTVDARRDRAVDEHLGLDRGELGRTRAPVAGCDVAREREEDVAVADLGGRRGSRRARAISRSGSASASRPSRSALTAFDHREHEQAIEQALRLGLADVIAQRGRVVVAEVVGARAARGAPSAARPGRRGGSRRARAAPSRRRDRCARDSCGSATAPTARPCARSAGDRRAPHRDRRARPRASADRSATSGSASPSCAIASVVTERDVPSSAREEGAEAGSPTSASPACVARRSCARRSSRRRARARSTARSRAYNELLIARERDATRWRA